jgi:hypothetical protein
VRHRGLQHRSRVGEAGGLQDHPAKHDSSIVEIAQQRFQRLDQIAAQRAAETTALQQHDVVADRFDQEMIEPGLAELVDDHGGLGQRRVVDQAVEQRGLAGAEKAGQHGEGNGFGRPSRPRWPAFGHVFRVTCSGASRTPTSAAHAAAAPPRPT